MSIPTQWADIALECVELFNHCLILYISYIYIIVWTSLATTAMMWCNMRHVETCRDLKFIATRHPPATLIFLHVPEVFCAVLNMPELQCSRLLIGWFSQSESECQVGVPKGGVFVVPLKTWKRRTGSWMNVLYVIAQSHIYDIYVYIILSYDNIKGSLGEKFRSYGDLKM